MSKQPDLNRIVAAAWPVARVSEALFAVARQAGFPLSTVDAPQLPAAATADDLATWIESNGTRGGLQVDQAFVAVNEIESLLVQSGPALMRLAVLDGGPFLAVLRASRRTLTVLGPDLRLHRLPVGDVASTIRRPFEASVEAEIDRVADRMNLPARRKRQATAAMLQDRLTSARFRGCWLVRLPPGSPVGTEVREAGIASSMGALVGAHLLQYVLFIASWWLLGHGVLSGTIDGGWLWGWLLLLLSLIPLRLIASWNQGLAAVATGAWIRRRLLRGAFMIDRQEIRRRGAGQLFGLVLEGSAIDALALTGGVFAVFSLVELAIATIVLSRGAAIVAAPLLLLWIGVVALFAWSYIARRRTWTTDRLAMSHDLLEAMVGHRTRLVQETGDRRHRHEDELLDSYIATGDAMDRSALWLAAAAPRGWLIVALVSLTPALVGGFSATELAISIGGVLLAYRALQRLVAGASNLGGAVIAGQSVAALARAASRREPAPLSSAILSSGPNHQAGPDFVAQAREITFRYRSNSEPVLNGCTLNIPRQTRWLLEGPSGSGKTTLASILAGLEAPESGVLLAGGLDRAALGASGWRRRVVMAPQAHDNYLVSASLAFNLLMGRRWPAERADLAEAESICRELGLGDLLDRLPGGLDQMVGETGWQLSQGERIRVFLARALLQRPELLILDESFSALDAENVERAMRCVAHRAPAVLAIAHP